MITKDQFEKELDIIIKNAIREDVGDGDYSSLACISHITKGKAQLLVKESGIIAGVDFAKRIFKFVDSNLEIQTLIKDGKEVKRGDVVFFVSGFSRSILKAERLILNSMQRMSAIATKTKSIIDLVKGTKAKILDTRKTTPGIRAIEKWAVKIAGAENHRFALYDMIMLKDNHIDFSGGVDKAIEKTKAYLKENNLDLKIIVEARNFKEIEKILEQGGVHRILIDNFSIEDTRDAVAIIGDKTLIESSGGIDQRNVREYAQCGVDYISLGILTHCICNMDLSLKVV